MMDWILEPETVLRDIGASFSNIVVVGHSFGAVCSLFFGAYCGEFLFHFRTCADVRVPCSCGWSLKEHGEDIMETLWTLNFKFFGCG